MRTSAPEPAIVTGGEARTVYVELRGGLGNQLFQYATASHLAILNGARLKLDARSAYGWRSLRRYELGAFRIPQSFARCTEIAALRRPRFIGHLHPRLRRATELAEPAFHFWPDLLLCRAPVVYMRGFWQSEKYFQAIRDQLLTQIVPHREASQAARRLAENAADPNAISVHIRRGDYVSDPEASRLLPSMPLDYYLRAVQYLRYRVARPRLFVFSDDIVWCRRNFRISDVAEIIFVSDQINSQTEELDLMRHFRNHIIANSTFSWWGAWLADQAEGIVVAPATWFAPPEIDVRDLLPERWIRI